MIDLHSHILPGIDDGAESAAVSEAMLDAAAALGLRTIVATPHLTGPLADDYARRVAEAHAALAPRAEARGIVLERGYEVRLAPDIPRRLREGQPMTLAGTRVVLVDLPFTDDWPLYADSLLFDIQASGFLPVLAHPERYPRIQRDPRVGLEIAERGVVLQLTTASLSGTFGKRALRASEALLRLGAVHFVATDAHSAGHRMAAVPAGLERLEALVGTAGVRQLTTDAPEALLAGEAPPPPVRASARPSLLRRLFARDAG